MSLVKSNKRIKLYHGDCRDVMKNLHNESVQVDAIVTDPPYELGFMGKHWDSSGVTFQEKTWRRAFKLLKPGGHLLAFCGTRTYHRMVVAIEDAGFEIRDCVLWMYGSGMPKSHNIAKHIDKTKGVKFDSKPASGVGFMSADGAKGYNVTKNQLIRVGEMSDEAVTWNGWGTALKPAIELICLARRPFKGNVTSNILKHGTGGLNIDACRIKTNSKVDDPRLGGKGSYKVDKAGKNVYGRFSGNTQERVWSSSKGRWPANVILSSDQEVADAFAVYGVTKDGSAGKKTGVNNVYGKFGGYDVPWGSYGGEGTVARFFYSAKANKADRVKSHHPTVKPVNLMKYLIKMVTPPGGTVLDLFCGSGSTVSAALQIKDCKVIAIEREDTYIKDIQRRIKFHYNKPENRMKSLF